MKNIEIIQHYNEIWEIKNFLLNDEIDCLIKKTKTIQDDKWENNKVFQIKNDVDPEGRILLNLIRKRICDYFTKETVIPEIGGIHRITTGNCMGAHIDKNCNSFYKEKIVYGCVMYLNDNYSGGEINYPELKITIKPTIGSLMIHKAEHLHEILKVKSGTRYMLTTFVHGNNNTKFIK
jgi:hypothetical protein